MIHEGSAFPFCTQTLPSPKGGFLKNVLTWQSLKVNNPVVNLKTFLVEIVLFFEIQKSTTIAEVDGCEILGVNLNIIWGEKSL